MEVPPIPLEELLAAGAEQRDGHGKATSIIGSSAAIASMISSSVLIWMIKRSRDGLTTAYHRILLGMCVADMWMSLGLAHFNVAAPRDVDYFVWNASGNQLSCNVQGFVARVGVLSAVLYSCSLNLHSLAVVRYRKTDEYVRRRLEPFLHGVPVAYAFVASTTLLVENNFNDGGGGNCYAPVYRPPHCVGYEDGQTREGFVIPCGRGSDGAGLFSYVSGFIALFIVPLVICTSLGMIYRSVLQQEEQMERYGAGSFVVRDRQLGGDADERVSWLGRIRSVFKCIGRSPERASTSNQHRSQSNSRAVMQRALAYSTSYFLTWSWFIIGTFCDLAGMEWPTVLWYLANIFNPLQGFFNFCIFMYPKVKDAKVRGGDGTTWFQAFEKAFWSRGSGHAVRRRSTGPPSRRWGARIVGEERPGRRHSAPVEERRRARVAGDECDGPDVGATV